MNNGYKEARISLYVIAVITVIIMAIYLISSLMISMGYRSYRESHETAAFNSSKTVIIDAGHGGEDPGAVGNGLIEKDLNLSVSLFLADILRANGYNVVMTRTEDVQLYNDGEENRKKYYDLRNRKAIAESEKDALFISIHMNKFPLESCKGIQSFYSPNNGGSKILAEYIQSSAKSLQPDNKRLVKDGSDGIYLLENLKIPAVLVECGFLSNQTEAKMLAQESYRRSLALFIYCGIADYFESEGKV